MWSARPPETLVLLRLNLSLAGLLRATFWPWKFQRERKLLVYLKREKVGGKKLFNGRLESWIQAAPVGLETCSIEKFLIEMKTQLKRWTVACSSLKTKLKVVNLRMEMAKWELMRLMRHHAAADGRMVCVGFQCKTKLCRLIKVISTVRAFLCFNDCFMI